MIQWATRFHLMLSFTVAALSVCKSSWKNSFYEATLETNFSYSQILLNEHINNTFNNTFFFFFQNQVLYALANPHHCSLLTLIPSEPTLTQFMYIYLKLSVLFNCLKTVSEQISLKILTIKVNWGRIN